MAPVALIFCVSFILCLLLRESKRHNSVSAALWLPTVVVFVLASRTPSLWLEGGPIFSDQANNLGGNWMDQVFFLTTIVGSLIIATSRGVKWSKLLVANFGIMLFYGYFLTSSIWSDAPGDSLIRILKDFGATVVVLAVIFSEKDPLEAVRSVFTRCACVLFPLSMLFVRYYPVYGRTYARSGEVTFSGAALQKNSLGEFVMICCLFMIWDHLETRPKGAKWWWSGLGWDRLALLPMGFWLLKISDSKTSLVCLLVGLILLLRTGWLASPLVNRIVFSIALSLPFLMFFTQEFSSTVGPIIGVLGRDATFTGRTDIWKQITYTTVNPLLGAGFYNFWGGKGGQAIRQAMNTPVPNAHDGYLDLYLDGGLLGLIVLFCLLVLSGRKLMGMLPANRWQQFRFAFLVVVIFANLTESNFARPSILWFTTLLVLIDFPDLRVDGPNAYEPPERENGIGLPPVANRKWKKAYVGEHRIIKN
jgi:O-antigen ligase